jgi:nicotinamidase-related amidase
MTTVLITQCLQRDFADPIGAYDPLPNLLHVGYSEAARLLGPEPSAGPLAQLIDWARSLAPDAIDLIHIRDWHDPNDPAQREHLQRFGAHCLQGSSGARLILSMDERAMTAANERIVDSLTLNDLEGTDLARQLERIRHAHGDEPLRVGVVGVWTEAKVSFLLYDLTTRLGIDELATCSALTASASRAQHFNALAQLEKILGVRCFDSPAEFADWLRPGAELALPHHPGGFEPRIGGANAPTALSPGDRAIIAHLFRDSTQVDLEPISGGYSGAGVWRATSRDALGHRQAPAVVKLGPNRIIAQERAAFEQVEAVLGSAASYAMRTVTHCSSRWHCCVTRSTRSASLRRPRCRSSRRWRRLARSPTRSPTPSGPGWPCGWTGSSRSSSGPAGSASPPAPGGGIRAATWARIWPSFAHREPPGSCAC